MTLLRSLLFNAFFAGWTVLLGLAGLPLLAGGWRSNFGMGRFWSRTTLWGLKAICGLSGRAEGLEHLPAGPCIVAMKHQSAWDTFAITRYLRDPAFVYKQELGRIPFVGWYMRRARMLPVDRAAGTRALKLMAQAAHERLAEGRTIVIYPEGTRTAPGAPPRYHPGVAALYQALNLPVVPVAVNSGLYWGRNSFLKRPGIIRMAFLEPLPPGLDRRHFMRELEERIEGATARLIAEAKPAART